MAKRSSQSRGTSQRTRRLLLRARAPETCEWFACRRERADLAAMLAMTLHNAAVQHEHLEQWKHALAVRQSRFSAPCLFLACY